MDDVSNLNFVSNKNYEVKKKRRIAAVKMILYLLLVFDTRGVSFITTFKYTGREKSGVERVRAQ